MTIEIKSSDYFAQEALIAITGNNLEKLKFLVDGGYVAQHTIEPKNFIDLAGDTQKKADPKTLFDVAMNLNRKDIVEFFLTHGKNES